VAFRAITLVHSGTTNQVSSISGTVPATTQAGDVLIIAGQQSSGVNTLSTSGPTTPSLISGPQITNSNNDAWLWGMDVSADDLGATATISSTGSGYFAGLLMTMSGVQTTGLVVATTKVTTATTSLTTPAVTTTVANANIVNIYALRAASATTPIVTVPGTHTKDGAATTGASGASPSFSLTASHRTTPGAAGSYGGSTATTNVAVTGTLFTLALQPTATGGTDAGLKVYYVDSGGVDRRCSVYYVNAAGVDVQVSDKTS
jgi:hypothetical protein